MQGAIEEVLLGLGDVDAPQGGLGQRVGRHQGQTVQPHLVDAVYGLHTAAHIHNATNVSMVQGQEELGISKHGTKTVGALSVGIYLVANTLHRRDLKMFISDNPSDVVEGLVTCSTRLIHWKLSSSLASGLCSATMTILSS